MTQNTKDAGASTWAQGVEAVAKMLDKKADDYAREYGSDDMGSLSFGTGNHAEAKRDYHSSLIELAEEVRAMIGSALAPTAEQAEGELSGDEAEEFASTVEDFEDNGETSTDYETLMDWAQRGLLECVHFNVTKAGTAAIAAFDAAPAASTGEQA